MQRGRVVAIVFVYICAVLVSLWDEPEARCKGGFRFPSGAFTSAPCLINSHMTSGLDGSVARCKGAAWFPSCVCTFAPHKIRSCMGLVLFEEDARCKGVDRLQSCALTSAPFFFFFDQKLHGADLSQGRREM